MNKMVVLLFPFFWVLASCSTVPTKSVPSNEDGTLYFSGEVKYEDISRIKPEIVAQCEIDNNLVHGFVNQSEGNGLPITNKETSRRIDIEVVNVRSGIIGFGSIGGSPASIDIRFTVTENGNVLLQQSKLCRTNLAGFLGLQPSACNKIEKCALIQGEYVSERVYRLMYE